MEAILGALPRWTSRPLATYWKMFLLTLPLVETLEREKVGRLYLESSMNMPILMRMQWKTFLSILGWALAPQMKPDRSHAVQYNIGIVHCVTLDCITLVRTVWHRVESLPMRQVSTLLSTMVGWAPCCSRNTRLQLWKLFLCNRA